MTEETPEQKFYITTPIYYVNDKPHIGSAYTTIAADVLARFHRARGIDTWFLTGTAEHGSKIAESAEKAGVEIQEFVDSNSAKFKLAWNRLNISHDDFIRTTEQRHIDAVNIFFGKLKESGKLYEGDYEGWYCVGCESFKT
ncbi:MAG TPA: class I tRNA ligase family protein, partial [Patescibacteria group bacterium]|nr:class I tRNA ligase family protein [Patescibacteria group bacterium]